jgi:hypothetical protein
MRNKINLEGIKLLPRDVLVLREVEDYGFRTHAELRDSVLKSYSREWSWTLMKRLVRAKCIREVRDAGGHLLGWSPEKLNAVFLKNCKGVSKIARGRIPKYSSTFQHDQELRWVLDQFKKLKTVDSIVIDSKLKADLFRGMQGQTRREVNRLLSFVPDARFVLYGNGNKYNVALELERTQKSAIRVRSKLEHYIAKTNYSLILYICSDTKLYQKIQCHYKWVLAHSSAVKFAKRKAKIYFCTYDKLKEDFDKAKFKGLSDEFSMGEIRA